MATDDKIAALADTDALDDFDGKKVVRTTITVTNAGDGLSTALAVDPRQLHHDEEVVIVMRGRVTKVGFVPLSADVQDLLSRGHTIKASTATLLDADGVKAVESYLTAQEERIKVAREKAEGIERLPLDGLTDGAHAGEADDPDDPLLGNEDDDTAEPERIDAAKKVEKHDDGWWHVVKETGERVAGPFTSRAAARIALDGTGD